MKRFNIQQLLEDADAREVAEFIGMERRGQFCQCVSGLHTESQLNHCAIYKNGIHCFSCGDTQNVVGMVMEFYKNILGDPVTYQQACSIVGDACGGHELYMDSSSGTHSVEQMPLTDEEVRILGFKKETETPITLKKLFREDKPLFEETVKAQASEMMTKYLDLMDSLGKSVFETRLKTEASRRYEELKSIYQRYGGEEPRVRKIFKLKSGKVG